MADNKFYDPYSTLSCRRIHPDAPAGGGGHGFFRSPGPIIGYHSPSAHLPHPNSPAGRYLTVNEIQKPTAYKTSEAVNDKEKQKTRLAENKVYLKNGNVKAFIAAIAKAEGGDYNLKFGGVKGKKNDKWQFSDYSTHPGTGSDGKTTAAGMYQINKKTWQEMSEKMGLTDFSPETQDLMAIEKLRLVGAIDKIKAGDIDAALSLASQPWAALPKGPNMPNRYPKQPYMKYNDFVLIYKSNGGFIK